MTHLKPDDKIICFCHDISQQEIIAAIEQGAEDLYSIQLQTLAATGCGGCESDILEILESMLDPKKP